MFVFAIKPECGGFTHSGIPIPASSADLRCLEGRDTRINGDRLRACAVFPDRPDTRVVYAKKPGLTVEEMVVAITTTWRRYHLSDGDKPFVLRGIDPETGLMMRGSLPMQTNVQHGAGRRRH